MGGLLCLSVSTRPDIAWITSKLSKFLQKPTTTHVTAAKRVLRYLRGTLVWRLTYCKVRDLKLIKLWDSDWGSSPDDHRSTPAYVFNFNGISGPNSWKSRKQQTTVLSSCEAEYLILGEVAKEAKYLQKLTSEMELTITTLILWCDNQGKSHWQGIRPTTSVRSTSVHWC